MPGIVGLVSKAPRDRCEALARQMASSLMHEPFYTSAPCAAPAIGVFGSSIAFAESANGKVFRSGSRNTALLFSGECLPLSPEDIVRRYEEEGEQCIARLNGLFAGLLIDFRRERAVLFNDRYGFDRIYIAETNDGLYFASEAKALLRVLPETRNFDHEGVAESLAVGCTVGERTLFRGVRLLPTASIWTFDEAGITKSRYFEPREWEEQPILSRDQFEAAFTETCSSVVPKYFGAEQVGIALTGGLDSRIVLAGRPRAKTGFPCYTYDGPAGTTLDSEISAELAKACGYQHAIVRIEPDFFADFADHTDRTVYLTDGYFGATGAHEVYLSAAARSIAPIRLTGVFGGEVFRGVSTFKPLGLDEGLFAPDVADNVATRISQLRTEDVHPVTAAAFTRLPQTLHGSLTACRSQLTFRTPYLDNEIVKLAYSTPPELRGSSLPAVRMLAKKDPELARIATDMGELGREGGISALVRRSLAKTTFKLDYLRNDGMPHWAASAEPILDAVNRRARIFGRHKYLRYREWFRRELADYVRDALASASVQRSALWNSGYVRSVAQTHVEGRRNCVQEINAILTVDAVERLLLAPARAASLETAAELEPATTASVA